LYRFADIAKYWLNIAVFFYASSPVGL